MSNIEDKSDIILISLRKIIRAIDLHSKQLVQKYGLTGPQMLLLKAVHNANSDAITSSQLANELALSQATITSILDRLIDKGYVQRQKSTIDKRKTHIIATAKAKAIFEKKPKLLQEDFVRQFDGLLNWEQDMLIASLERVAYMMHAKEIDAAPVLTNEEFQNDAGGES